MQSPRTYLDYNASAPLLPEARAAMLLAMDCVGNASSIHGEGRAARAIIETARISVAALAGVGARQVVFTSGGTEAANLALTPDIALGHEVAPFDLLLAGAGEHLCVLGGHRFASDKVQKVALTGHGTLDLDALGAQLAILKGQRVMLAIQVANNETGVIQPVAEACALVHAAGGIVVCDGVQGAGRLNCTLDALGADMLVLSAHKLGGPKGAGALILANAQLHPRERLVRGGGQEFGMRAGTENVAAIAGFGAAIQVAGARIGPEAVRLAALRNRLEVRLRDIAADAVIFGFNTPRIANTSAFAVPGLSAETALIGLDLAGIAVSSGSACSSGKVKRSHVLEAMAIDARLAQGALRVSLGWSSCSGDIDAFCDAFADIVLRSRRLKNAA